MKEYYSTIGGAWHWFSSSGSLLSLSLYFFQTKSLKWPRQIPFNLKDKFPLFSLTNNFLISWINSLLFSRLVFFNYSESLNSVTNFLHFMGPFKLLLISRKNAFYIFHSTWSRPKPTWSGTWSPSLQMAERGHCRFFWRCWCSSTCMKWWSR